ncbi:hypothetical protein TNCV_3064861 [Trichonephila clavipes]|nr:hypothetical protein TNCV_3064861 [Trichonephila clavipes]
MSLNPSSNDPTCNRDTSDRRDDRCGSLKGIKVTEATLRGLLLTVSDLQERLDWYRANLTVNLMDCSRNVFSIHFEQRPRRPLKSCLEMFKTEMGSSVHRPLLWEGLHSKTMLTKAQSRNLL